MDLRPAELRDIPALHVLRSSVRENRLRDPSRVTFADYERYLAEPGMSWVAVEGGVILGFAIADRNERSIWALFVAPTAERRGVGRALLAQVTTALLNEGTMPIVLTTEPGTRAEHFYLAAGWTPVGTLSNGERKLEFSTRSGV